jgi:IrrE N-terminal-like domain
VSTIVFEAPPLSGENIEGLAEAVRRIFSLEDEPFFPVVAFAEKGLSLLVEGLTFDVVEAAVMGPREGAVDPLTSEFMIREDVYDGAVLHQPRHRFTIMHEAGHAIMHVGKTLNRVSPMQRRELFRDPEWQADRFASAVLMPRNLIRNCRSEAEITSRFGVSGAAARARIKALAKMGIQI